MSGTLPLDRQLDIQKVAQALERNSRVHDWQIRKTRTVQSELYLIGESVESERQADTESATVTLYHDRDGRRGSATLTFVPGGTADAAERIERAVFMAGLAGNPPHQLAGPAPATDVAVRDRVLAEKPVETIRDWSETVRRVAADEPAVRLSAAEFFIYHDEVEFLNSRGATHRYPATRAFIELVLISARPEASVESENYHSIEVRSAADLDLQAVVRERAALARDMLEVTLPGQWTGPVVISGEPLLRLFDPFLARANAENIYRNVFPTKLGDNLFGNRPVTGDPLDLTSDATLPYGIASAPADAEGLPGRRVPVLVGGRVENLLATKRFADYLGLEPTGARANVVVGAGTVPAGELMQGPAFHLVSFADLRANPLTGEFVSEIRLGYAIDADGRARPVKGGAVTGNVFDAFAACRLSRETIKVGRYFGPQAIRFDKLVIAG